MKLASIEQIKSVEKHPNAEFLSIVSILGYRCIVKLDQFKAGEWVCLIQPDTVLPDAPWATFYKAKSNRVKAIRLRQVWSEGIVEQLSTIGYTGPIEPGLEISSQIGITKFEPPVPQDLSAKGGLPYGLPTTDEERINNLETIPWGELVDVTLKIDGQSFSAYMERIEPFDGFNFELGVCGRRLEYKLDCVNNFTRNEKNHKVHEKLSSSGVLNSICLRGEQYGAGIQSSSNNPHSKLPLGLAFFSVYFMDNHRYAYKGDKFYAYDFIPTLGLPVAPMIEKDVVLTPELVKKYAEDLTELNGQPFEGVVIQHRNGSFKIINKSYDAKK